MKHMSVNTMLNVSDEDEDEVGQEIFEVSIDRSEAEFFRQN